VKNLELLRVQEPEADPYAPADGTTPAPDTSFPFGANAGEGP
jgi:hypothetical protein